MSEKIGISYIALLLFIGGIIFSPTQIWPGIAPIRPQYSFALIASIGLIIGLLTGARRLSWTPIQSWYALFMTATAMGLLNLIDVGLLTSGLDRFSESIKTLMMLVLIISFASERRLFNITFNYFLLLVGLFQIHCIKAIMAGVGYEHGRFDSWVGQISNSDFIGTFFVCMVPVQLELGLAQRSWLMKALFLVSALAGVFIMVQTQTRAAFLALVLVFIGWMFVKEQIKLRVILLMTVIAFFIVIGLATKTETQEAGSFFERMRTIFSSESLEVDQNAQSRLLFWSEGVRIWHQFPVLGTGLGGLGPYQSSEATRWAEGRSLSDHSLHQSYIQILAERGAVAFICYLMFLLNIFLSLSRIRKLQRTYSLPIEHRAIAKGIQLGMVAYLVGSLFMSVHENWILIFLASFTAALRNVSVHSAGLAERLGNPYIKKSLTSLDGNHL